MLHVSNIGVELAIIVMSRSSDAFEDRLDSIELTFPNIVPRRFRSKVCNEEQWNWEDPLSRIWSSPSPIAFDLGNGSQD
jgi:hypothetical protein